MNKVLDIENLTFAYEEKKILENFSCSIEQGNFVAIVGENGSGKSSIFDAMTHALFGASAKSSKGVNLSSLYSSDDASIEFEFQHRN